MYEASLDQRLLLYITLIQLFLSSFPNPLETTLNFQSQTRMTSILLRTIPTTLRFPRTASQITRFSSTMSSAPYTVVATDSGLPSSSSSTVKPRALTLVILPNFLLAFFLPLPEAPAAIGPYNQAVKHNGVS